MDDNIKDIIQDCNLNFLLGSGLSSPFLRTLGRIESLLTDVEQSAISDVQKKVIKCSLYKLYFDGVMVKNLQVISGEGGSGTILQSYYDFFKIINSILLQRKSTILSKEVNVFTTNIDVFLDKALEDMSMEYNDGFNGRFVPSFSLSNFKKSRFKKSLHYDNISELPVFNLLKLHGSLTWHLVGHDKIVFSRDLQTVSQIEGTTITPASLLTITETSTIEELATAAETVAADASVDAFLEAYEKLLIVNPTKEKFKHTILNQTYYELLRLYANELEKENTVLFAMGFSFADEHIREITLRSANSNPTLMIYVIAHSSHAKEIIEEHFGANAIKNGNIKIIAPLANDKGDAFKYDLATINRKIFGRIFDSQSEDEVPPESEDQVPPAAAKTTTV